MTKERAFATPKVRGPVYRRDRTLFDWVGGPDGATNGDVYKPKLKLRDDYPIEYSCEDAMEGRGASISEVWFRYDYELTLDGAQDPAETRRAFEWSVLWNVGVELGLYNCSIDMQQGSMPPNGRRLMQEEGSLGATDPSLSPPSLTRVIALGNDEEDQMNVGVGKIIGSRLDSYHCMLQSLEVLTSRRFLSQQKRASHRRKDAVP